MHFRARLVVKVDGKLKQSKKMYDLIVEKDLVSFKDPGMFTRSFPKPDKVVVGSHVARIQQGSRYFLCRFLDRTTLLRCAAKLGNLGATIIDYHELKHQDSTKQAQVEYCLEYMSSSTLLERDTHDVQRSLHAALFDSSR